MKMANGVLAASTHLRLVEGEEGDGSLTTNDIPVRLVSFPRSDKGMVAIVIPMRKAILVDGREITEAKDRFSSPFTGACIEKASLLGLFLLHECGHIVNADYLKDPPPVRKTEYRLDPKLTNYVRLSPSLYNLDPTFYKDFEELADAFAADRIRDALALTNRTELWSPAVSLALAAVNSSFNAQSRRLKFHFGAKQLGDPAVLADPDLAHPNLELRLLRINYGISQSPDAKALLDDFLAARTNVHFLPRVIYIKTN